MRTMYIIINVPEQQFGLLNLQFFCVNVKIVQSLSYK